MEDTNYMTQPYITEDECEDQSRSDCDVLHSVFLHINPQNLLKSILKLLFKIRREQVQFEFGLYDFEPLTSNDYRIIGMTIIEDQAKSALKEVSSEASTPLTKCTPIPNFTPEDKVKFLNRANRETDHILIKLNKKQIGFQNQGFYDVKDLEEPNDTPSNKYGPKTQIQYYNPKPKFSSEKK